MLIYTTMAKVPQTKTTNKNLFDTIRDLKKLSTKTDVGTWKAVAAKLAGPASQRARVNLSKLDKVTKAGETVIVPGKILGDGTFSKKITVIAFSASEGAIEKLEKAGAKYITIDDYIAKAPKDKPRIIG